VKNNFFRPPYGRVTRSQLKLLTDRKIVMWNRMAWDFDAQLNVPRAIRSMKKSKLGSILLFHDTAMAFENLQLILPEILHHFKNQGLALRTLND
ncbi:MAG: polysaccharide deacetylase family protein, partial [Bacteroidota bacterium]